MSPDPKGKPTAGAWVLTGKVVSGVGQAAFFTQLDWVQEQCGAKLGFRPYPGTLNLELDPGSRGVIAGLPAGAAITLVPPDPRFCEGRVLRVRVDGVDGALIIPAQDVNVHGADVIEIMAPVRLKDALKLRDGDRVRLRLQVDPTAWR